MEASVKPADLREFRRHQYYRHYYAPCAAGLSPNEFFVDRCGKRYLKLVAGDDEGEFDFGTPATPRIDAFIEASDWMDRVRDSRRDNEGPVHRALTAYAEAVGLDLEDDREEVARRLRADLEDYALGEGIDLSQ